jgi:hypothetical protein
MVEYVGCRSLGCEERAVFHASLPAGYVRRSGTRGQWNLAWDAWSGDFCGEHLIRCLELKIKEIPYEEGVALTIKRIVH